MFSSVICKIYVFYMFYDTNDDFYDSTVWLYSVTLDARWLIYGTILHSFFFFNIFILSFFFFLLFILQLWRVVTSWCTFTAGTGRRWTNVPPASVQKPCWRKVNINRRYGTLYASEFLILISRMLQLYSIIYFSCLCVYHHTLYIITHLFFFFSFSKLSLQCPPLSTTYWCILYTPSS